MVGSGIATTWERVKDDSDLAPLLTRRHLFQNWCCEFSKITSTQGRRVWWVPRDPVQREIVLKDRMQHGMPSDSSSTSASNGS